MRPLSERQKSLLRVLSACGAGPFGFASTNLENYRLARTADSLKKRGLIEFVITGNNRDHFELTDAGREALASIN